MTRFCKYARARRCLSRMARCRRRRVLLVSLGLLLQSRCLELLRILGSHGGADAAEAMNGILTQARLPQQQLLLVCVMCDVMWCALAQIATATDGTRNAGNAVLYECVSTIMNVEAEVRSCVCVFVCLWHCVFVWHCVQACVCVCLCLCVCMCVCAPRAYRYAFY